MGFRRLVPALFILSVFLYWGCQENKPFAPYKITSLSVSIPPTNEVRSSLLGVASNELLYRVDGPNLSVPIKGTVGPFSTASTSGTIDFTVDVPNADSMVLSLQLNNASTHQPLAVGATGLNLLSAPVSDLVVEMGSVTRNCYFTNFGGSVNGTYAFKTDTLSGGQILSGPAYDVAFTNAGPGISAPLTIQDAQGAATALPTVAYLGNGDFVDYDYVPPASAFQVNSVLSKGSAAQVGDIYCLKLGTIPGGHAWIQVTFTGNGVMYQGPRFRFRINHTSPYYVYEQTAPDIANACSTMW